MKHRADTAIVVFAKAPRPGLAKTRLIPALGADGAARLAQRFLGHTLQQALAAGIGPVELCCTPGRTDAGFADAAAWATIALTEQSDGDLGTRMARAFARVLRQHARAILIGTDTPGLDAAYLRSAAQALDSHDAVFGPAADGGYTLVGLKRPHPVLFSGMQWSHPRVMAETRARIAQAGLHHAELPVLHDIDGPADLVHLPAGWLQGIDEPPALP